jgi:SOS-response transcriptional repressor LexA
MAPEIGAKLCESHGTAGETGELHAELCRRVLAKPLLVFGMTPQLNEVTGRDLCALGEGGKFGLGEGLEIFVELHKGKQLTQKVTTTQAALLKQPIYEKSNVGEDRHMDIRTIRLANLETLLKEISKADLSRALGKKPNYLSQIHTPGTRAPRPMGYKTARSIEAVMKRPAGWMDLDHSSSPSSTNTDPGVGRTRRVPVIRWDQVRRRGGMESILDDPMEDTVVIFASDSVGVGAFGLRVRGDSMVDTATGTGYPDGAIIVVDPTAETQPGDAVVVLLATAADAVFKILEFDGQQRFLKPLNTRYPIAPLPEDAQIIGRVVQVTTIVPPSSRR